MTFPSRAHPLDVDLADFVDGMLDDERRGPLEEHLGDCLLCRIKVRRLRDAATGDQSEVAALRDATRDLSFTPPAFELPTSPDATDGARQSGEVWSAGGDQRILVLVLARIDDARVIVVPVSFDIGAADDETIIVPSEVTPLRVPLAIYSSLRVDVPAASLRSLYGRLTAPTEVERLVRGDAPGTSRGSPITGATDPRLELRQFLADQLGDLDEIPPDPDTTSDAPPPRPEQVASKLASDLRAWRGSACRVATVTSWERAPIGATREWTPLLSVDEVGVLLVVFDTPSGLNDEADFDAGRSVLTRFNATALVVLASTLSSFADIFSASDLHEAITVPFGERKPPRPSLSNLYPFDAVMKFLDQNSGWVSSPWPPRATVTRVDVAAVLRGFAEASLGDVVAQGRRAHIPAKAAGYTSTQGNQAAFENALTRALSGDGLADAIAELSKDDL